MAVMDVALRTLLASPVSAETLEVLESLGPPRERLGRAEAFARVALEAGAFRSAMATFPWLNENDTDPQPPAAAPRPRVRGRRARQRSGRVRPQLPPARRAGRPGEEADEKAAAKKSDKRSGRGEAGGQSDKGKGDKADKADCTGQCPATAR